LLALAGGSPAAFFAQRLFRHKTKKIKFKIIYRFILLLQFSALLWLLII
ncbi:MAG: DUF1294 domain-containing protein, partial [Campylobacterota bacterium]|nr:DUF1294 domain-containing protein [Campylobacterota bacterium]